MPLPVRLGEVREEGVVPLVGDPGRKSKQSPGLQVPTVPHFLQGGATTMIASIENDICY